MYKRLTFALLGASLATTGQIALAQTEGTNPSVTHLVQTYSLSKAEAQQRIDLQSDVIALSERLNTESDASFADMYIQHQPVFKIVLMFSDKSDRKAFVDSIDPKMRRFVQLKNAKRSRGILARELDELATAIKATGVAFGSKYDLPSERFVVTVETDADAAKVQASLPATRKVETDVLVQPLPKTQAAPAGVVAGDTIRGGQVIWQSTGASGGWCSLGYAVNYTVGTVAKQGFVTAGHCYDTMYARIGSHDVTLSGPIVDKPNMTGGIPGEADGVADKYDYQIWETTGLTVSSSIAFVDKNSIPEFPDSGTLKLTGITSFNNQKAGMIVCKSGETTGITCGQITNGNAYRDGSYGWIEVSKTSQRLISDGGDSGGPWFLYPGTGSTITGVGIHSAGNAVLGPTGIAIYMPIDYIDDHIASVNTIKN